MKIPKVSDQLTIVLDIDNWMHAFDNKADAERFVVQSILDNFDSLGSAPIQKEFLQLISDKKYRDAIDLFNNNSFENEILIWSIFDPNDQIDIDDKEILSDEELIKKVKSHPLFILNKQEQCQGI